MAVIWAFTGGGWLLEVAYPLAAVGAAFLWAGFAVVRWLPGGWWLKGGLLALLTAFATPVFNSLCDLLIEDQHGPRFLDYFSVGDMLARRNAGNLDWVNILMFQLMLVCALALTAVGVVMEVRRRRS